LDLVAVSSANQYSVKPLELVRTFAPLIFAVVSAELDEPPPPDGAAVDGWQPDAAGVVDVLPHAAAPSATATRPAAHHRLRLRIGCLLFTEE
jgi:hypothetical protein